MPDGIDMAIGVTLTVLLGSILLPIAFDSWFGVDTSSWGSGAAALWPIIPVISLVGVLYFVYRKYAK